MNYEVNSFQDYKSITIDELKNQANSLLNLVTEDQRPLRVCMNNGKEFLLFPQDLLAPICDSDFRLILLSAMRLIILSVTFSFWMISFSYWLPMRLGGILKITQNTSRIRIFGMTF